MVGKKKLLKTNNLILLHIKAMEEHCVNCKKITGEKRSSVRRTK